VDIMPTQTRDISIHGNLAWLSSNRTIVDWLRESILTR